MRIAPENVPVVVINYSREGPVIRLSLSAHTEQKAAGNTQYFNQCFHYVGPKQRKNQVAVIQAQTVRASIKSHTQK